MINWEAEKITEPPLLKNYSDEQLRLFEENPLVLYIPSNSQNVERCIQLMASKATKSSNPTIRDGLCKDTLDENDVLT